MKRSEINTAIEQAIEFFGEKACPLPEYAHWSPQEWEEKGADLQEVKDLGLGWDVTDFGSGNLENVGRTIFTLRNGRANGEYPKAYAQKVMHMPEGQKSIVHYHRSKMEDIHNQGGGNILISLWPVGHDGGPASETLLLSVSGHQVEIKGGDSVLITPGNWICLPPRTYHQFWAEEGAGAVLSIEISSVCNDHSDNFFWPQGVRFPVIEEDAPRRWILCSEYTTVPTNTTSK